MNAVPDQTVDALCQDCLRVRSVSAKPVRTIIACEGVGCSGEMCNCNACQVVIDQLRRGQRGQVPGIQGPITEWSAEHGVDQATPPQR